MIFIILKQVPETTEEVRQRTLREAAAEKAGEVIEYTKEKVAKIIKKQFHQNLSYFLFLSKKCFLHRFYSNSTTNFLHKVCAVKDNVAAGACAVKDTVGAGYTAATTRIGETTVVKVTSEKAAAVEEKLILTKKRKIRFEIQTFP